MAEGGIHSFPNLSSSDAENEIEVMVQFLLILSELGQTEDANAGSKEDLADIVMSFLKTRKEASIEHAKHKIYSSTHLSTSDAGIEDDSNERVGCVFHDVKESDLKPGDHIYCHRALYTHHGIFISNEEVIHFTSTTKKGGKLKISARNRDDDILQLRLKVHKLEQANRREEAAREREHLDELVEKKDVRIQATTLSDFLGDNKVHLVTYSARPWKTTFKISYRCHIAKAMPPSETVRLARYYCKYPEEWKEYDISDNNCETFACYCKTGLLNIAGQLHPGRSALTEILVPHHSQTAGRAIEYYRQFRVTPEMFDVKYWWRLLKFFLDF